MDEPLEEVALDESLEVVEELLVLLPEEPD